MHDGGMRPVAEDADVRRKLGWRIDDPAPDQDQMRRPLQHRIGFQEYVNALEAHDVADEQDEPVSGQLAQAGVFRTKNSDIVGYEIWDDLVTSATSDETGMTRHRVAHRNEAVHHAPGGEARRPVTKRGRGGL